MSIHAYLKTDVRGTWGTVATTWETMVSIMWRATIGPCNTSISESWHVSHVGNYCHHMVGDGKDDMETYHWSKQYEHFCELTRDYMPHGKQWCPMTWRATIGHKQYKHIRKLTREARGPMCACHMAGDDDGYIWGATIGRSSTSISESWHVSHVGSSCRHISESWHVSHMAGDDANDMESYHWFWAITSIAPKVDMWNTWQVMMPMTWRATIGSEQLQALLRKLACEPRGTLYVLPAYHIGRRWRWWHGELRSPEADTCEPRGTTVACRHMAFQRGRWRGGLPLVPSNMTQPQRRTESLSFFLGI